MELKAVLFDVDGTIAESEELHRNAFNESFKEYGLERIIVIDPVQERLNLAISAGATDVINTSNSEEITKKIRSNYNLLDIKKYNCFIRYCVNLCEGN